jgi:RNA polymerase sigma-54 factor
VRKILVALKEIVDNEDKSHPLSDERLVKMLQERGYAVARRTVAKYRTQLGIAESRMRKQ